MIETHILSSQNSEVRAIIGYVSKVNDYLIYIKKSSAMHHVAARKCKFTQH